MAVLFRILKPLEKFHNGYSCVPNFEPASGLASFPVLYSEPRGDAVTAQMPNLFSLLQSFRRVNCTSKRIFTNRIKSEDAYVPPGLLLHFWDTSIKTAFYLIRLDARCVMSLISKSENDGEHAALVQFVNVFVELWHYHTK